ncbi:protease modulator HflC [Hansschlegelia beijingensis]|uniref:Protein HflC n=1 Tax=Hansschlegelia beijingensis TaxID=1133344 RepID=A0A7W6D3X7_9HYPH|nr:protease modulator HflC [Hansschlegelia beijingensis]MBB3971714.1 membrane protease subunit HflC [Hansschlegelia beijingensis]
MNRSVFGGFFAAIVLFALVALYSALYTVYQTQQVIVLRFGQPVATVTEPGLHVKMPFIETVTRIDKRILDLDMPEREATTNDQKRLVVDAFSRYRITNPLRFRQAVGSIEQANARLTNVLTDALLEVIRSSTFQQIVRDRRDQIMERIRDQANREADRFGIQVVDVLIRRADLPEQNSKAVFERMESERAQEAAEIRARGAEQAQGIRARADRDSQVIIANANRDADIVRGQGEAEKTRILAEAYSSNQSFFEFYRSMQAYETALKNGTRLVLAPDNAFLRFFQQPAGAQGAPAAPTGAPPAQ